MSEASEFWRGEFGNEYTARNDGQRLIEANEDFFFSMLDAPILKDIASVIEFGANKGLNLRALHESGWCNATYAAVEINPKAAGELRKLDYVDVFEKNMLDGDAEWGRHDLVISKGLLIHIDPSDLDQAYQALYDASKRYILIAEYYNPTPVEVEYRGNAGRLWKRDFAGEMLDRFPDLRCVHYQFFWRRDRDAPQDDITAFLLEKTYAGS